MKIKSLFVLSLAALSFAACSNDEEVVVPQEGSLVIDLSSVAAVSKAAVGEEDAIGDESTLTNVWVYTFDKDGKMYGEPQFAQVDALDKTTANITWQLPEGNYTIAAVSGLKDAYTDVDVSTLPNQVVTLANNSRSVFVMYGSESVEITGGSTSEKTINVARVLAGVKLLNIKTAFGKSIPQDYKDATKILESIKIVGSKGSALLSGSKDPLATTVTEDVMTKAKFEEDDAVTITNTFAASDYNLSTAARAYACPDVITRITIGINYGEKIGTRYYSVAKNELAANTMYGLRVTITGVGSDNPDNPTPVGDGDYAINAKDWTTGTVIEESTDH